MLRPPPSPALKALLCQIAGLGVAVTFRASHLLPEGIWFFVAAQAGTASLSAWLWRSDPWWPPIHAVFLPLALLVSRAQIPPLWFLGAFVLLALIFRNTVRTRVPLYLSNRKTVAAVADILRAEGVPNLLDVGSGTGSLLTALARHFPERQFSGVESAPLPLAISRWQGRGLKNLQLLSGDLFTPSWRDQRCIYAFLSPHPMAEVWHKATAELPVGALLISNSFPVPGVVPTEIRRLNDRRQTSLYIYRIGMQLT